MYPLIFGGSYHKYFLNGLPVYPEQSSLHSYSWIKNMYGAIMATGRQLASWMSNG